MNLTWVLLYFNNYALIILENRSPCYLQNSADNIKSIYHQEKFLKLEKHDTSGYTFVLCTGFQRITFFAHVHGGVC